MCEQKKPVKFIVVCFVFMDDFREKFRVIEQRPEKQKKGT